MRLFAAALLLALVPGLAHADSDAVPGNAHLAAAQRLYQKLDLDAALAELKEAEVAAKDNEDETAQILIYKGLIFSETGKSEEAQNMFKRALAMRPWAEVPPDTSPRLAKTFADARKSVWGNANNLKAPPRRHGATPASSAAAPKAVPATSTRTDSPEGAPAPR